MKKDFSQFDDLEKVLHYDIIENRKEWMRMQKILSFDFETTPLITANWGRWDERGVAHVFQESYTLCICYKWFGEKKTHSISVLDYLTKSELSVLAKFGPLVPEQMKQKMFAAQQKMAAAFREILCQADVMFAHNGQKFDLPRARTDILLAGLPPASEGRMVDTYTICKRKLKFSSNRLDHVAKQLGFDGKLPVGGIERWVSCMKGSVLDIKKMVEYCKHDVELVEWVGEKLYPYWGGPLSVSVVLDDDPHCTNPTCKKDHLVKRGWLESQLSRRQRYFCRGCGSWLKGRTQKY